ncbi:hypothetical protein [Amycolatopsis sp. CB00013]|uniref:hypothetical protein n=1 Tax=Amycolatopsis sp. CB00013 TaxID=1703945 RepID=UPI00093F353E|nr:hypothetical protein [Amycolatopsis sp. CB00013]OKJ97411.1 hypothetical protein AMK34_10425 [Amycolatopsis sp. CB00013]
MSEHPTSWQRRIFAATSLLLAVAIGTRVTADLLAPLVPLLITAAVALFVLAVATSWWRR